MVVLHDGDMLFAGNAASAAVDVRRSRTAGGAPPRSPTRPSVPSRVVSSREPASLRRLVFRCRQTPRSVRMLGSQLLFNKYLRFVRSVVGPLRGRHNSEAPPAIRAAAF